MEIGAEKLTDMYRRMILVREFETRVGKLFAAGELPGFVHLYVGQEAIAVGTCAALNPDDYITSTHRGHGHLLAKGGEPRRMMAELYGKKTGYCKGKGGSMHIAAPELGILGANGIVGAGVPIAAGAALTAKTRGTGQVAVAFFGDGASNEGSVLETLNLAAAFELPVVFICENNLYAVSTSLSRVTKTPDIAQRAGGFGMPGVTVDGNDVLAVYGACRDAIDQARAGKGPVLVECKTYRVHSHFEGDQETSYRTAEEVEEWTAKDPILRLHRHLVEQGVLNQAEAEAIRQEVIQVLDDAVEYGRQSPLPEPHEALDDVYA